MPTDSVMHTLTTVVMYKGFMANFQDSFAEVAVGCMYAGANALSSLLLQCLWESFALPVIVTPLVEALTADQPAVPSQPVSGRCSAPTATPSVNTA